MENPQSALEVATYITETLDYVEQNLNRLTILEIDPAKALKGDYITDKNFQDHCLLNSQLMDRICDFEVIIARNNDFVKEEREEIYSALSRWIPLALDTRIKNLQIVTGLQTFYDLFFATLEEDSLAINKESLEEIYFPASAYANKHNFLHDLFNYSGTDFGFLDKARRLVNEPEYRSLKNLHKYIFNISLYKELLLGKWQANLANQIERDANKLRIPAESIIWNKDQYQNNPGVHTVLNHVYMDSVYEAIQEMINS
jgi:hypothetical protein